MQSELADEILNLRDGDHLCLFYDKGPAEQMPALIPFIQDGLCKDEQFIYVADDQTMDELAERLQQSGIDVGQEVNRGALKLWTRREWRQPGRLSSERKSLQVLNLITEAANSGFRGARFSVEMTWALGPDIDVADLEHWEATLNSIFVPGFRGRITCQYNRSRLSPEALLAAFHTHPLAVLGGEVFPNWFYEAPLILDENARPGANGKGKTSAARVEWMISVLRRARAAQREREELIEKKAALAQAELSRTNIENILSLMPAAVYTCDESGRITFFNRRAAELWGREPHLNEDEEKFCGSFRLWRPDGALLHHSETPMAEAVRKDRPTRNTEVIIERPDGSKVVVSINIDPLHDGDGRRHGAINVFQDITGLKETETALRQARDQLAKSNEALEKRVKERTAELEQTNAALLRDMEEQKRLQEQLRQAQKLESLGTLAGGIAHDFNNILNIIKGYTALIGRYAVSEERIRDGLKVVDEAVERGAAVVRQLLTLARKTEAKLAPTDINGLVADLSQMVKQTFPKIIDVVLDLEPGLPLVPADPNQINQALLNLCVNTRQAMPAGGTLTLKTKNNGTVQDGPSRGTTYVSVEVSDTGIGMNETVRSRVFEPFYTTKRVGEGTGLGLAIVYGILKNHNGFVDVESEAGQGSTFRLYLPVGPAEEKTVDTAIRDAAPIKQVNGRGTVLLAEDEEAVAHLLRDTLAEQGYKVLVALDGAAAIDLYQHHRQEINIALLDIGLPKVTGWDVILKLKEDNPNLTILVTSGYIQPEFKSHMYKAGVKGFIYKPYVPEDVLQMIESEMGRTARASHETPQA